MASSFEIILFVKSPGNYSPGLSCITQGISRLTYTIMLRSNVDHETALIVFNSLF
jgi:hypothetical protein